MDSNIDLTIDRVFREGSHPSLFKRNKLLDYYKRQLNSITISSYDPMLRRWIPTQHSSSKTFKRIVCDNDRICIINKSQLEEEISSNCHRCGRKLIHGILCSKCQIDLDSEDICKELFKHQKIKKIVWELEDG